jgi:hypothetical protein
VYENAGATINSVQLFHRTHAGSFSAVPMSFVNGHTWRASIPNVAAPVKVYYYVRAADSAGNVAFAPTTAPSASAFFTVGPTTSLFCDGFDFDQGWSVSSTALTGGQWVRGDPIGTQHNNKIAQPEDDDGDLGTLCWFTEQGAHFALPEDSDVDGGPTRLVSPALDLSGTVSEIAYSYWHFNSGADDSLTVELSANGVQWITARSYTGTKGGWKRDLIDVNSYLTPGPTVQVRFVVADSPNDSITEAAIDQVCVTALGSNLCLAPQVFCSAKVNSQFCTPSIGFSGHPSVSNALAFTIGASQILNQRSGLLFYGYGQAANPFKGGHLCCALPIRRTPTQSSGGNLGPSDCSGTMTFDMNAWIQSGADPNLVAGQPVAAQFYYRDPQDPYTIGLTDAVSFVVCP